MVRRAKDAEAELNLPPGFRFHPTDEELVVHYLCKKAAQQFLPVPIIAEVDLYKYDPWQLPEKALFGQKEWYFFTPRDRKYPNGSRPNRAAGSGYWKATGADKPVTPCGSTKPLGIKKALVFYEGKAPRGAKTNWIMHEYRLADANRGANSKKGSLRLDDWVLCRLYYKKGNWEKELLMHHQQKVEASSISGTMDSFEGLEEGVSDSHRSPISDVDNDVLLDFQKQENLQFPGGGVQGMGANHMVTCGFLPGERTMKEDSDWFMDLNLDDLHNSFAPTDAAAGTSLDMGGSCQDFYFSSFGSVLPKLTGQSNLPPF